MRGRDFAHVQDDVNPHILRMLEDTFSIDLAQLDSYTVFVYFGHISDEDARHPKTYLTSNRR